MFIYKDSVLQIYWLKDRVEVQPERDPNYIQAADGHLIIIQAREKDRGNYTCVADNVANRRLSPPARLSVVGMCLILFIKVWESRNELHRLKSVLLLSI